jgi:hypothetical protein
LGLGPGDPEGSSGAFMSPRQQVAMGQMGSLGALRMTALDTLDTTMSEIDGQPHMLQGAEPAAAEDPAPQRWTSTSAELWPVWALKHHFTSLIRYILRFVTASR